MARTDTLDNFLSDVADSIRGKTGETEPILASEFDTKITGIQTNEFVLQDKTVEINGNGTMTITADAGYDGLNNVIITVNVNSGEEELDDYITDGLIAWFDGETVPTDNSYWYSNVGTDYIFETTGKALIHNATSKCYMNNKTLSMLTGTDYYKEGYTIEIVGCINSAVNSSASTGGWFFCMNETGSMGIGVTEAEGNINFVNNGDTLDRYWQGYYGKKIGASLYLEDVVNRGVNTICSGKASVNGCSWIDFTETSASAGRAYANNPILAYYIENSTTKGSYLADGYINCIRVYNRQLTYEELTHNHTIDKARFGINV